jgi:16S rRNA (adenine1518-N6/adenine1519-N6)-dimethyltransferase
MGHLLKPGIPSLPPINVARLLRDQGIRPDKSLGQNFLQDDAALRKIVSASQVASSDTILEIGPGLGSLTRYLAISAKEVVAVELDPSLLPVLSSVIKGFDNVRVVQGDILKLTISDLIKSDSYQVVANIPYYITSAIFRHLLEGQPKPKGIVLTVQKEVAQRICARPGDMSLLALSVQVFGQPEIVAEISSEAFYPEPNVDSSVIRLDIFSDPAIPVSQLDTFFRLAKAGFGQKRKTLRNSLSAGLSISGDEAEDLLKKSGIVANRRAETLSVTEWATLSSSYDLSFSQQSPKNR